MAHPKNHKESVQQQKEAKVVPSPRIVAQQAVAAPKFSDFIFKNKSNRLIFGGVLGIAALLLILFKYCLPMPDFSADSHGYVIAAAENLKVYYRPLGYSKFLKILHNIAESASLVVIVQYFLIVCSGLFLFFSIDYLYGFRKKGVKYTALVLMTLNPAYLVVGNQILADGTFAAFTVLWFATLIWIHKKAPWWALVAQVIFLYWCFELRYNALYYPAISVLAFILAVKAKPVYRFVGILASLVIIANTVNRETKVTEEQTQAPVFSGFSGWMMANNALIIYKHAGVQASEFDDPDMQLLDKFTRHFIDSISPLGKQELKENKLAWPFMWDLGSPLKQYVFYYRQKYRRDYFTAWYQVSPLYYEYGKKIIMDHPGAYIRHFAIPNAYYFFWPLKVEMKQYMNYQNPPVVPKVTQKWFGFESEKITGRYPGVQVAIGNFDVPLHGLAMIGGILFPLLYLLRRTGQDSDKKSRIALFLLWTLLMALTMAFSIVAGPIVLRYQMGLFILCCGLPLWFLDQFLAGRKKAGGALPQGETS